MVTMQHAARHWVIVGVIAAMEKANAMEITLKRIVCELALRCWTNARNHELKLKNLGAIIMKLPMQAAPVRRNFDTAKYAIIGGIKPSKNLCSCHAGILGCHESWNHCPNSYPYTYCEPSLGGCNCYCCNHGHATGGEGCIGPYE